MVHCLILNSKHKAFSTSRYLLNEVKKKYTVRVLPCDKQKGSHYRINGRVIFYLAPMNLKGLKSNEDDFKSGT